jgi:hypothetical protein
LSVFLRRHYGSLGGQLGERSKRNTSFTAVRSLSFLQISKILSSPIAENFQYRH